MDSFNQTEEEYFSSSESGWTKYIVSSPSNLYTNHDDDYFSSHVVDNNNDKKEKRKKNGGGYNKRHDIEDVDSLTSDASSGPSHIVVIKDDDEHDSTCENKSWLSGKKMFGRRSKEVKETKKQGNSSGVKGNSRQTGYHVKKR